MRFAEASAVTRADEGTWKAEVQPDWDIFGVANGGYLMAIAARAMSEASGGRTPVTLTAHFTRPLSAGPIEVAVETVKTRRTFSTMRATVTAESDAISLLGSFAEPGALAQEELYMGAEPPEMPPPDQCVRIMPAADGPLPPPLMDQFEERLHPDDAGTLEGRLSGIATIRGWFRLHDDEPMDPYAPAPGGRLLPAGGVQRRSPIGMDPDPGDDNTHPGHTDHGLAPLSVHHTFRDRRSARGGRRDLG